MKPIFEIITLIQYEMNTVGTVVVVDMCVRACVFKNGIWGESERESL